MITTTREVPQAPLQGLSETEAAHRYKAGEGNQLQARAGRSYAAIVWQATFVPILAPSNRTGAPHSGPQRGLDWRPAFLAVAMVVLFGVIMALPLARWFYEIEPIPLADAFVLSLISIVWALVVFVARQSGFVDRLEACVQTMTAIGISSHVPRKAQ